LWVAEDPSPATLAELRERLDRAQKSPAPSGAVQPAPAKSPEPALKLADPAQAFPFRGLRGVSPLAMATVVSEITSRADWSAVRMAELFCQCIQQACAVGDVELYFLHMRSRKWVLAGSSSAAKSGNQGLFHKEAQAFEKDSALFVQNALLVPFRTSSNFHWGTLILSGGEIQALDRAYARALSKLGIGILRSFVVGMENRSRL
jgi:hypothetical protein